jgi:hypothetical protein
VSGTETMEQVWTEEEVATFWQSVGTFREGLPEGQRDTFDALLAGALQATERGGGGDPGDEEAAAFGRTLASFRDGLPPRQREAFNSVVAAGASEVARGRAGEEDVQGYWIPAFGAVMWGTGVIAGAALNEAGVFDAIPSPDALKQKLQEQQKGKGKPPA